MQLLLAESMEMGVEEMEAVMGEVKVLGISKMLHIGKIINKQFDEEWISLSKILLLYI